MANAAKMKDNPFFVEYVAYEWKEEQKMGDSISCTGVLMQHFQRMTENGPILERRRKLHYL